MYVIYNPITKNMGDEKQKCTTCDRVKKVDEFKQKRDAMRFAKSAHQKGKPSEIGEGVINNIHDAR